MNNLKNIYKPIIFIFILFLILLGISGWFMPKNNVKGNFQDWLNGVQGMPIEWYDRGLHYEDTDMSQIRCQERPWSYKIKYDDKIFNSQRELADYIGVSPALICKWHKRGLWKQKGIERIK